MPRTEMRVETLDYGPAELLARRGIREQMARVLMTLDVLIEPSATIGEDFWGLLKSEIGMKGLNCEEIPRRDAPISDAGTVVILRQEHLAGVLAAVRSAIDHWVARGHSRQMGMELAFVVAKGSGMERAEVRGPVESLKDALEIGADGFSEVGRRRS
jgi:hypothetical protein